MRDDEATLHSPVWEQLTATHQLHNNEMFNVVWNDGGRAYAATIVGTCGLILLLTFRHAWNFVHAFLAHEKAATNPKKLRNNLRVGYDQHSSPFSVGQIAMMADHQ